jgi:hypothetical protein
VPEVSYQTAFMDAIPQPDFKWFGEGFDGFPKKLPEDVVEYIIFFIDTKLSDIQTRERLQAFQRALVTLEKEFLKEYIWQRDSIALELVRENSRWMLKGHTNYGDSVADEWLIVWLLRELSREFKDAWIRIYDTDGEFLLIEAANALPKWLNPEVAENRVWINNHRLLVAPLSKAENARPLTLEEALAIAKNTPTKLQYMTKVEDEAFHRLKNYPAAISENQHHARLPLPRKVAHILHIKPSYIAPAIEAFYLRDPISLRHLHPDKSKVPLVFAPKDFVHVSVRFTKVLYAQLLGQNWMPPGSYGTALEHHLKTAKDATARDKVELGIKVAAGLEMLIQYQVYTDKKATREIKLLLEDLETGDDALPTDAEIAEWPKSEDDEAWLNIDFAEFERELAGKGGGRADGFGDKNAQENLRKMVERFNAFLADDEAGLDGAEGLDPMDMDNDSDEPRGWDDPEDSDDERDGRDEDEDEEDEDEDEDGNDGDFADKEFAEYEAALENFMMLSSAEKNALTDDARDLARAEEAEQEEDEEIQKLSEMMESELFSYSALNLKPDDKPSKGSNKTISHTGREKGKAKLEKLPEEDVDEDDEDYLDEDYNLADNMLKSFKGQVGMPGPAGNLMALMGVQFPPDADTAPNSGKGKAKTKAKG